MNVPSPVPPLRKSHARQLALAGLQRIFSLLLATALVLPLAAASADSTVSPATGKTADPPSARLLAKASEFRKQAQSESEVAFVKYVGNTDKAKKLFSFLGKTLCPKTDPAKGWTYFFETSIWSLSFPSGTSAVAVFYHPWSDVALVTVWTRKDSGSTLDDADLIVGDALRNLAKPPYDAEPQWLRGPVPAYLAAGISSAQTVRGFEKVFAPGNKALKDGWRSLMQADKADLIETNRAGVGTLFERNLAGLTRYQEDAAMAPVRNQTKEMLAHIRAGRFDAVYKVATETKPQVRAILKSHADKWGDAKVITCVTRRDDQKRDHTFVVLSMPKIPELFMSFWYQEGANKTVPPVLARIDMIDQNQTYKYLGSIEKMNEVPVRGDLTRAAIDYADWVGRLTTIGEASMQAAVTYSSGGPVGSLLGGCCDELIGKTLWDTTNTRPTANPRPARDELQPSKPPSIKGAASTSGSPPSAGPQAGATSGGRPPAGNAVAPGSSGPPPGGVHPGGASSGSRPPSGNPPSGGSGPPPIMINPVTPPVYHPPAGSGGGGTLPPHGGGSCSG